MPVLGGSSSLLVELIWREDSRGFISHSIADQRPIWWWTTIAVSATLQESNPCPRLGQMMFSWLRSPIKFLRYLSSTVPSIVSII